MEQRELLKGEGKKSRIPKLPEAPLIRIRDEGNQLGPEMSVGIFVSADADLIVIYQQAGAHRLAMEPRFHHEIVVS